MDRKIIEKSQVQFHHHFSLFSVKQSMHCSIECFSGALNMRLVAWVKIIYIALKLLYDNSIYKCLIVVNIFVPIFYRNSFTKWGVIWFLFIPCLSIYSCLCIYSSLLNLFFLKIFMGLVPINYYLTSDIIIYVIFRDLSGIIFFGHAYIILKFKT